MAERAHSAENTSPQGTSPQETSAGAAKIGSKAADVLNRIEDRVKDGDLGNVAAEMKGAAVDLKTAAVEQGRQMFESAKSQATGFADQRKDDAAQSVSDLASSLRETGKTFGERPNIQAFVGSAADGLDQLATGLRERSFAEIYGEVEGYARRSPVMVGAVAAVAGFLLARFIKSSSDELAQANVTARAGARRRSSANA